MTGRILIVDDEPDLRKLVGGLLRRQGYEVEEAASGAAALEAVQLRTPSLILLDVMMPGMDGHEVARRLRSNLPTATIPIVMLTVQAHTYNRAEGLLAGAVDYITKPFDPADLAQRVTAILKPESQGHPADMLAEIAHGALIILNVEMVWLLVANPETRSLRSGAIASVTGEETARIFMRGIRGSPGEISFPLAPHISPLCDAALDGAQWIDQPIAAIAALPGGELLARGLEMAGARAASIVPLALGGHKLGAMLAARRGMTRPLPRDPGLIGLVANLAATAIDNTRLLGEIERREVETRRANLFHQTLVNTMGDGLVVLDEAGRIQFVNRRLTRMLGYEEAQLIGREYLSLVHPDDAAEARKQLDRTGGTASFETRILRANGLSLAVLSVLVPPHPGEADTGSILVLTDLTGLKAREAALEKRNRQMAAVNHASRTIASSLDLNAVLQTILKESVEVLDAQGGSILLEDNPSGDLVFQIATGPGSERLSGMRVPAGHGIVGWVAQQVEPALVADARRDNRFYGRIDSVTGLTTTSIMAVPLVVNRRAIGVVELVNKVNGFFDEDDLELLQTLAQSAATAIDNARLYLNLRRHADELQKAYAGLQTADKLKEEMIQNISHELWTPLTVILGYIGMMADHEFGPLTEQQQECLETVLRKAHALSEVVKDTVTLVQLKAGALKKRPVDFPRLIERAIAGCLPAAQEAGILFEVEAPPELPGILADEERMSHVLDNLLDNALKFSPRGGRILIRVDDVGPAVQLSVNDHGIGIPSNELPRVFDRFYQVDGSASRRYGGVGLGLAICKEIVEAHGGEIWAESREGKGSSFYFTLLKEPAGPANS